MKQFYKDIAAWALLAVILFMFLFIMAGCCVKRVPVNPEPIGAYHNQL